MIEVKHIGSSHVRDMEQCFCCHRPTPYMYERNDVPCCHECAPRLMPEDVPTKREWLNADLPPGEQPLPDNWVPIAEQRVIAARAVVRLTKARTRGRRAYG